MEGNKTIWSLYPTLNSPAVLRIIPSQTAGNRNMPEMLVMIVEEMKKSRALYSQILALQSGCGYSLQAQSQAAPLPVSRYCCHTHSCLCPLIAAEPELKAWIW